MSKKLILLNSVWLTAVASAFFAGAHFLGDKSPATPESTSIEVLPVRATGSNDDPASKSEDAARDALTDSLTEFAADAAISGEAISSRLSEAFNLNDPVERKRAILNLIADLDAENIGSALVAFEGAENKREIDDEFRDFLYAWAKIDGAAAATYALDPESKFRERYGMVNVATGWAATDPAAAKAFVNDMESGETKSWMHYGVFKSLLESDLTDAMKFAQTNEKSRARGYQMDRLARKLHETYGADGLVRWVESIDHEGENDMDSYKEYALKEAVEYIGKDDPNRATDWVLANLDKPYMDEETLRKAAYTIGDGDAQSTMSWLSELPDSKHKGRAIHEAVERLADRDPNGVASWLNEVGNDPAYDSTFSTFATQIVDDDPISALNWALAIRDEGRQTKTVQKVLGMWRKSDPDAAKAWLQQNGIKS